MKRFLVLTKNSRVTTKASAPNQCKEVGHEAYDYELDVHAGTRLDNNGFIIDHTILHNVIDRVVKERMGSCETLCLDIEKELSRELKAHGCRVHHIELAIKPVGSNAWIKLVTTK